MGKKFLSKVSAAALLAILLLASCSGDRSKVLKIYNWADYIDEELLEEFRDWYREQTGEEVTVVYQLFDINEVMLSKIERGHEDFDIVCPSDYIIERMLRADLLLPIDRDFGDTPNYIDSAISPFIKNMFDKIDGRGKNANDYAVGYMWGTTGYLYNTKYVQKEEVLSWNALANPRFAGKIFVKDAFRDVYSPLLIYLKQKELQEGSVTLEELMLDSSDESIALVENYLKSVKGNISGWEADFGKEGMTQEKAWLNFTWSGDASWAIEEAAEVGVPLDYVIPKEGSNVWFDGWVIPKYAKNVKAAKYFINFMCKPENAIRNMDEIGYVSAVASPEVFEYMEDEEAFEPLDASYFFGEEASAVCLNPVFYADRSDIEKCAMMHDSGERTEQMLAMWSRVKGDNASGITYVIIAVVVVGLIASAIVVRVRKSRKSRKYGRQLSRKKVRGI